MALTEEKRGKIAFRYLVKVMEDKPIKSKKILTGELTNLGLSKSEAEKLANDLLVSLFKRKFPEYLKGDFILSEDERGNLSWRVLLVHKYQTGIKIGQWTRRELGNEATRLGISLAEAEAFVGEVLGNIVRMIFLNWQ